MFRGFIIPYSIGEVYKYISKQRNQVIEQAIVTGQNLGTAPARQSPHRSSHRVS